jgi:pyruvate dehydrogenase E1 component beta subunit
MPGLTVVTPALPQDNYGLLKSALASGDPVIYMEHKELWGVEGDVVPGVEVPLGKASLLRAGSDLSIVTWSRGVSICLEAAEALAADGIGAEVIDLRTLWPWDKEAVYASAGRTGRLLVVHEAVQVAGFGAEIAASAAETLGCKVRRVGAPRIPVGYAQVLENEARLSPAKVAAAARAMVA